jgi:hypothetical protein
MLVGIFKKYIVKNYAIIFMFKINENTSCITLNCMKVSYIVTINTYNVSIVRIKLARSTIGSSEVGNLRGTIRGGSFCSRPNPFSGKAVKGGIIFSY